MGRDSRRSGRAPDARQLHGEGESWTILAGNVLGADEIVAPYVDANGAVVQETPLSVTQTPDGLTATHDAPPMVDHYMVFSARVGGQPQITYFVNVTDRGGEDTTAYFEKVYSAVFRQARRPDRHGLPEPGSCMIRASGVAQRSRGTGSCAS